MRVTFRVDTSGVYRLGLVHATRAATPRPTTNSDEVVHRLRLLADELALWHSPGAACAVEAARRVVCWHVGLPCNGGGVTVSAVGLPADRDPSVGRVGPGDRDVDGTVLRVGEAARTVEVINALSEAW